MDEKVTILNPPAAAFAAVFETYSYFVRKFILSSMGDLLTKEQLFVTKTAMEKLSFSKICYGKVTISCRNIQPWLEIC